MAKSESKFVKDIKMMGAVSYKDYIKYLDKMSSDDIKQHKYALTSQKSIWNKFVKGTIYTIIVTFLISVFATFYKFYQSVIESSSLTPEEVTILIKGAFLVCVVFVVFLLMVLLLITVKIIGIETRLEIINEYLEKREL